MSPRHRILDGLPPYGPMALRFPASGPGMHSEGFVVEITGTDGVPWVGNFRSGLTDLHRLVPRGRSRLIVIAGGAGYLVDADTRACVHTFGGQIEHLFEHDGHLIVGNGLWLEATDGEQTLWRSRRVSWDGMREVRVDGHRIVGEAFDVVSDAWHPFEVDMETGELRGGAYPPKLP